MSNMSDIIKFSKTLKLLYVEDHREARDAMLQVLNEFFDDITIAFDGEDGLDKFQSNKIDLIITDVNMPKMDGLLMVEKIRSTTTTNTKIPVIVLSAFNETDYFLQSIRIGVEGYLLKPIELAQFMNILNKVVSRLMLVEESRKNENILKQYKEMKFYNHETMDRILSARMLEYYNKQVDNKNHTLTQNYSNNMQHNYNNIELQPFGNRNNYNYSEIIRS